MAVEACFSSSRNFGDEGRRAIVGTGPRGEEQCARILAHNSLLDQHSDGHPNASLSIF